MHPARSTRQAELHRSQLRRKAQVIRRPEGRPAVVGAEGAAQAAKQRRVEHSGQPAGKSDGLSVLSGRELEVSELVAEGCTNRQIARMLFLSEKTVETYLARVFVKLGVSTRAGVAGAVARAQFSDSSLSGDGSPV